MTYNLNFETNTLVLVDYVCLCFNEWYCKFCVERKRLMLLCVSVLINMMVMMICSEYRGSHPFTFNISTVDYYPLLERSLDIE